MHMMMRIQPLPAGMVQHLLLRDYAYISTGENISINNTDTWQYTFPNATTDLWTEKTPFEGPPTTGAVGFSLSSSTGGGVILEREEVLPDRQVHQIICVSSTRMRLKIRMTIRNNLFSYSNYRAAD